LSEHDYRVIESAELLLTTSSPCPATAAQTSE
jgi:hypothetical protein